MGIGISSNSDRMGWQLIQSGRLQGNASATEDVVAFAEKLKDENIKVACFDMDQTIVAAHSEGRLPREGPGGLRDFLYQITADFKSVVPELHSRGIRLAVATHSDQREYNPLLGVTKTTHILGEELVDEVLHRACPDQAKDFFVVAYNPFVRHGPLLLFQPEKKGKRYHIRKIMEHYGIADPSQVILFDDDPDNVASVPTGCRGVKIDPTEGFRIRSIIASVAAAQDLA